jgi:hypothetical protein
MHPKKILDFQGTCFVPLPYKGGEISYIREASPLLDSLLVSPHRRGGGIKKRGLRPLLNYFPLPLQGKGVRGMGSMVQRNETL